MINELLGKECKEVLIGFPSDKEGNGYIIQHNILAFNAVGKGKLARNFSTFLKFQAFSALEIIATG